MENNCTPKQDRCENNFIKESVLNIDRLQKKAIASSDTACAMCNGNLLFSSFNTIPVTLYTCCGNSITATLGVGGVETTYFRVESVRCCRFATLQLLELVDGVLTGTEFTILVDLDCIGRIQCFAPINVETCVDLATDDE